MERHELDLKVPNKPRPAKPWQFQKGRVPHNKGVPLNKWMDGRKIKKVLGYLELHRAGNPHFGKTIKNHRAVVGIKDGKMYPFNSLEEAARKLNEKGIKCSACNIRRSSKYGKYKAGGLMWFYADEPQNWSHLVA